MNIGRRCSRCGYVTIKAISNFIEIPLKHLPDWEPSVKDLLIDQDDASAAQSALAAIRNTVLARVRREVDANPPVALQWLIQLLSRAEDISNEQYETASRSNSLPYRVAQIMYALLLRHGPPDFGWQPPQTDVPFFVDQAYSILTDIVALSNELVLTKRGLHRLKIKGQRLIVERRPRDLELLEFGQNVAVEEGGVPAQSPRRLAIFDESFVNAQRSVLGRSVDDLLAMIDPAPRDTGLVGRQDGDLVSIDVARCRPDAAATVQAFTLTRDRLRRFQAPFFFDLGMTAHTARSDDEVEEESGEMLWLAYYPFLDFLAAKRPPSPLAISTIPLMTQALANFDHTQSYLLQRLQQISKKDAANSERLNSTIRSLHSDFEKAIGEKLSAVGMKTVVGLDNIRGRALACGEIDVIASAKGVDDEPLVLVCEAKNVDLALQKDAAYENLGATMKRAREQVARKASWVKESWTAVGDVLQVSTARDPTVIGMLICRRPVPLSMLGRWPGAVPAELEIIAHQLLTEPKSGWRSDLRAGVIEPTT